LRPFTFNFHPNPDVFDGFRFAKLRESEAETMTSRYQTPVSPSNEHFPLGLTRHAWWALPPQFMIFDLSLFVIAVNEIKALLAHVTATYDTKLRKGRFRASFSSLECVFPGMRT